MNVYYHRFAKLIFKKVDLVDEDQFNITYPGDFINQFSMEEFIKSYLSSFCFLGIVLDTLHTSGLNIMGVPRYIGQRITCDIWFE